MKTNKIKVGDTLFSVDPQRLLITRANVVEINEDKGRVTMRENCSIKEKVRDIMKIALDKFPFEHNGIIYFRTEDDAHTFVKLQIGI